ncbi:MAG: geranylgeranylglyceryl/heptaprenylglyceryl phosphate synthase [Cyclobacteriaceae bacterium]|nr:geranylgeranylglyceryl/heptaprenylglyceryl phosphate synthase [Cyclobacteriaceae bacterium]
MIRGRVSDKLKSFIVLIDPDAYDDEDSVKSIVIKSQRAGVSILLVGGSLISSNNFDEVVRWTKKYAEVPVVLFPGSNLHINSFADGILFLSLISGRNPEFLIGQHVVAAPILKRSGLEILSTGYVLIDAGVQTTVSYISNTNPIPANKDAVAACTALAGVMLGMNLIFLDAGSGAQNTISPKLIHSVKRQIDEVPLLVGGGINTPQKVMDALLGGADSIIIGNVLEENQDFVFKVGKIVDKMNKSI